MIRLGKAYGNLMVDVMATNAKLRDRCIRIVAELTQTSATYAEAMLNANEWNVRATVAASRSSKGM